jgi:alkylation response protein AidB-like acyl-CoA dehydrogenase
MLADTSNFRTYAAALERLAPLIAEHRGSFDRDSRVSDAVFKAIAEAGLFRLWLPKEFGGPELSPIEFMKVVEAASALDGSVGWLVANGGGMSRAAGYLPQGVADEWFADPYAFIVAATGAVGQALPVSGGYRVTGRWPFGSGCNHATRFMALAVIKDGDTINPSPFCFYFSPQDVTVHDTWHVSGLRGTGSHDFEVRDAFVPADHTHDLMTPTATQPGVIYRIPGLSIFPWSITGASLGIASGILAAFINQATHSKPRPGSSSNLADREMSQLAVGRSAALIGAARAFLEAAMDDLLTALDQEEDQRMQARVNLRIACAHAAETAMTIAQLINAEAGSSAIFESSHLERANRDLQAAVRHIATSPQSYIAAGRLQLGRDFGAYRL